MRSPELHAVLQQPGAVLRRSCLPAVNPAQRCSGAMTRRRSAAMRCDAGDRSGASARCEKRRRAAT
eukprot:6203574-Pleurochrysis_carterae.AAC.4